MYILSDSVLITIRKHNEVKYSMLTFINLNEDSMVKSLPDTQLFTNLFTLIGDRTSVTFVETTSEAKTTRMQKFEEIIGELKKKSGLR